MTRPGSNNDDMEPARVTEEAAHWFTRLKSRVVDTAELSEFYAWRKSPANAAAYDALEAHWRASKKLGDDRDIADAIGEALQSDSPRAAGARGVRLALIAGLIVLAACTAFFLITRETVYETTIGEQRLVQLQDGSRVHLDTDSEISVALGSTRQITLARGRAYFDVARDPDRKFIVLAGDAEVEAIGTVFEVARDAATTLVTLVEGKVAVDASKAGAKGERTQLLAGQSVSISHDSIGEVGRANVEQINAWTRGRLEFRETPLKDAIAQVNRYARKPITLAPSRWSDERVNGGFAVGDVDAFVEAVTALYPLQIDRKSDGSIHLHE